MTKIYSQPILFPPFQPVRSPIRPIISTNHDAVMDKSDGHIDNYVTINIIRAHENDAAIYTSMYNMTRSKNWDEHDLHWNQNQKGKSNNIDISVSFGHRTVDHTHNQEPSKPTYVLSSTGTTKPTNIPSLKPSPDKRRLYFSSIWKQSHTRPNQCS